MVTGKEGTLGRTFAYLEPKNEASLHAYSMQEPHLPLTPTHYCAAMQRADQGHSLRRARQSQDHEPAKVTPGPFLP